VIDLTTYLLHTSLNSGFQDQGLALKLLHKHYMNNPGNGQFLMGLTENFQFCVGFIHSFFHSGYFYSTSSSQLLLRGAPNTARTLCRSFTPKRHRQLRVKDLPKVPIWWLDSNVRCGSKRQSLIRQRFH